MVARRLGAMTVLIFVATTARALSLEEAFAHALRWNPEIQAARESARRVHHNVPLAIGNWLPTVQLRSSAGLARIDSRGASVNSEQKTVELAYSHNLYAGGRRKEVLRQAEEEVRQAHAGVEEVEQGVLLRVATAYLDVLRAQQTVELRRASLDVFEARTRETKAQFDVGDRTQADVAQADSAWGIAVADVVSATAELGTQRALFETLAGVPADELATPGEMNNLPRTLEEARRTALQAQPAVRAAHYALEVARHAESAAERESGPRLDLEGTVGRTADNIHPFKFNTTETRVGVRLTVPLYQAGTADIRVRQATNVRRQRQAELLAAQREVLRQVTSAWNDLEAARERYAALRAAVTASEVALAAVQREAGVGERTTREVLDAQRSVVSNQVTMLATERDSLVSTYRLLAATGTLTARAMDFEGTPDLHQEAREVRLSSTPTMLRLGLEWAGVD